MAARGSLSRRLVLDAAVDLADRDGLGALTMRRLAEVLGVEAMSLYHHVPSKDAVLDGVVEVVVGEIAAAAADAGPPPAADWQGAVRARVLAAREVLLRHRWAPALISTRAVATPEMMGHFEGLLGVFRAGGFSYDLAHKAMHALGSRALGFAQELFEPAAAADAEPEMAAMIGQMADRFPHIVGMLAEIAHEDPAGTLGWCDDQAEFEFGLDLLLDGLERRRATA